MGLRFDYKYYMASNKLKKPVDPEQVMKLAQLGCKMTEIADFFECSHDYIQAHFLKEVKEGAANLRISLRRAQLEVALEKHNPTMLIWLGKNLLKQTDVPDALLEKQELTEQEINDRLQALIAKGL